MDAPQTNPAPTSKPAAAARKPASGMWRNAVIALAILLIVISLMLDESHNSTTAPPPTSAQNNSSSGNPFQADGSAAREILASLKQNHEPAALQTSFEKANDFSAAKEPFNAYLLWFYSARKGHAPSAMKLAEQADPLRPETPYHSSEPYQAFKWYQVALRGGVAEAQERLDNLKDWAEKSAAAGDRSAQRLLLQWQSKNG